MYANLKVIVRLEEPLSETTLSAHEIKITNDHVTIKLDDGQSNYAVPIGEAVIPRQAGTTITVLADF